MGRYLLIESRDPYEFADVGQNLELAADLAKAGHEVGLFLVQNGVLTARHGGRSQVLALVKESGVDIMADSFSLKERGINKRRLVPGVRETALDVVIDRLAEGCKVLWH